MLQHLYTLIICILLLAGCKNSHRNIGISQEKNKTGKEFVPGKNLINQPKQIPPQYCRLGGMIAEVKKTEDNQARGCKIGPCYAVVEIKQIVGY